MLLCLSALAACGGSGANLPAEPPPPSDAEIIATVDTEGLNLISVRLDEIKLSERAKDKSITVNMVWMIPLDADADSSGNRFQYIEGQEAIAVSADESYKPTGKWFISIERKDLVNQDFGVWFVVTATSDTSAKIRQEFEGLMGEVIPLLAYSGASMLLTGLTPGFPDEMATTAGAASHGGAVIGRIQALGTSLVASIAKSVDQQANAQAKTVNASIGTRLASVLENLSTLSAGMDYIGEVYVVFPQAENYRLNNRVVAQTTDGLLDIEFSVFETTNSFDSNLSAMEFAVQTLATATCNPDAPSNLFSGSVATTIVSRIDAYANPINANASVEFTLRLNDEIVTKIPYCNERDSVMWWYACEKGNANQCGWIAENRRSTIFLKAN